MMQRHAHTQQCIHATRACCVLCGVLYVCMSVWLCTYDSCWLEERDSRRVWSMKQYIDMRYTTTTTSSHPVSHPLHATSHPHISASLHIHQWLIHVHWSNCTSVAHIVMAWIGRQHIQHRAHDHTADAWITCGTTHMPPSRRTVPRRITRCARTHGLV